MSKYGVFSGPYNPVFSPNTGKYGPEKTTYLDTFHTVIVSSKKMFKYRVFSDTNTGKYGPGKFRIWTLSTQCNLCIIRFLLCGNSSSWFLNLNLIYETLWSGERSGLLITKLEKLKKSFSFDCSNNYGAIDVRMYESFLDKETPFKMQYVFPFYWSSYVVSTLVYLTAEGLIR